jgi:hypothetical protein
VADIIVTAAGDEVVVSHRTDPVEYIGLFGIRRTGQLCFSAER